MSLSYNRVYYIYIYIYIYYDMKSLCGMAQVAPSILLYHAISLSSYYLQQNDIDYIVIGKLWLNILPFLKYQVFRSAVLPWKIDNSKF